MQFISPMSKKTRTSRPLANFVVHVPGSLYQHKRCQKKHEDVAYKLLLKFFQKYFVVQEQTAIKIRSVHTFIISGRFILVETVANNVKCTINLFSLWITHSLNEVKSCCKYFMMRFLYALDKRSGYFLKCLKN